MKNLLTHNSVDILNSFSKKELRHFDFYFEKLYKEKKNTRQVFNYLMACYPRFSKAKLLRKTVLEVIFGNKKKQPSATNECFK